MKKDLSVEFKIIFVSAVILLAFITVGVARQLFKNNYEDVKFVYNSAQTEFVHQVNNSDILSKI